MEGSLVGGLVAEVEGEAFVVDRAVGGEALALEEQGAIAQPVMLGETFDQQHFGGAEGEVLADELALQRDVFGGVFPWQEEEQEAFVGQAVFGVIAGGSGFAFFCYRPRRELGVRLVGGDLRFG